jgi:enediyne biosynthesis thioesterase
VVGFEDTNAMGNVYFSNYLSWQGKCRELFIREKTPELIQDLDEGLLTLITLHCSCTYLSELKAFDEVSIDMSLDNVVYNRVKVIFEYRKLGNGTSQVVASGIHEIGCFCRDEEGLKTIAIPSALMEALEAYK